ALARRGTDLARPGRDGRRPSRRRRRSRTVATGIAGGAPTAAGGARAPLLRGPQRGRDGAGHGLQRGDGEEPDRQGPGPAPDAARSGRWSMSSHDTNESTLSVALADLAESMPEDPNRAEGIRARVQRRRNRRRAARAAAGLAVAGATIAVIAAVRPGPTAVSTTPASPSSEPAPVAAPACDSITPPDTSAPTD